MARRTAKPKPCGIRDSAILVNVYNEGLCVYLHDEGHTDALRRMIADRRKYPRCSPKKSFLENLAVAPFARDVAARGLAVAYTLEQDDEISAGIAVGPPLTKAELAQARWLPAQYARLSLPTGRLRIDSANTMPLDPDEKSDEGAVVEAPPGDYILTLHRVDWDELRSVAIRYKGPQEFLLLTPAKEARGLKPSGPTLKLIQRRQPSPGAARTVSGRKDFPCKIAFLGYWEPFGVNITRAAAARIGLLPGARLRFRVEKFLLEALFLGEMTQADFKRYGGAERLEQAAAPFPEFAISEWTRLFGRECLGFQRIRARRAVPERMLEKWIDAGGETLDECWELPRPAEAREPQVSGRALRAGVLFSSPDEVVLSAGPQHMDSIGARPGDILRLDAGKNGARAMAWGSAIEVRDQHVVLTSALSVMYENFYRGLVEDGAPCCFYALGRARDPKGYKGALPVVRLDARDRWPVVAIDSTCPGQPQRPVLRLTPFSRDGERPDPEWMKGLEAGMLVEIRK